jgi:SAM-dependent methyltransferase
MLTWLYVIGVVIIGLFAFVLMFGAPYLPTLKARQKDALELLDLKPGQLLLELGSGDGRMLKLAAKQGIKSIGYELNPLLVLYSRIMTFRYRRLVRVKLANFWSVSLPPADGIYVFLLDPFMARLHNKITQELSSSVKVVSFAFKIPSKKPVTEKNGMYLYEYASKK